ncbi:MAG: fibrinogen-like YCDxxxxGGGW domain-containing protein, partial [Sandaracinaceae bacterium]
PGGSRGGVGGGFGLTTIDGQPGQGAGGGSGATGDDAGGGGGGHDARGLDGTADGSGAPGVGGGTYVSFASLTGGSGGGGGSSDDDAPTGIDPTDDGGGGGGGGGGTVVIDALGDVSVSGHIDATGGPGGLSGCSAGDGGGGSGGTIVVTSPRRVIAPLARLDVRGGPGGVNSGAGGRGQVYAGAPPTCTDGVRNLDETDVDCGGIVCAGCPVRSACRVDSDCGAGDCVRGFCQAAHCGDGTRSGTETDADCGGPACLACGDGAMCAMDRDCVGTCDAATCVSCADGTRNQGESDVDCGGPACGGCADGATCSLDADCAGSGCEGGRCVSCVDGVLDDMETGVDCGGPECGGCAGGEPCHASRDCLSGMCTASTCTGDARSCAEILARYPGSPSGRYTIRPAPSELARAVWCDMTTDGGGWTLVGASFGTPLDDAASAYYADLATMAPSTANPGIWDGMRPLLSGLSDVRFTCTATYAGAPTAVDLSFYANDMYASFTAGDDAASCGRTYGGTAVPPYPARRDNATGRMQAEGDRFDCAADGVGPILEDFCGDTADFTVDFDDHGMDCDQGDGTDWGEDDGTPKCGQSGVTAGSWQVWVRE